MTEQEVEKELATQRGMNINVNLPAWNSNASSQPQPTAEDEKKKKRNQLYIAGGILFVLIVAIILVSRKK